VALGLYKEIDRLKAHIENLEFVFRTIHYLISDLNSEGPEALKAISFIDGLHP